MTTRLISCSLVLLAACSSNQGPSAADIMKACTDMATADCNERNVCSGGGNITRVFGDMATCIARETLTCTINMQAPTTGASPTNAESCAAAYPSYTCADYFSGNLLPACLTTGPKVNNTPCAFNSQCASTYCNDNRTSTCGTCGDAPAATDSCLNSTCARGQDCAIGNNSCVAYGQLSQSCDNDNAPCVFGLTCFKALSTDTLGVCVAQTQEAGQACGPMFGQCDSTKGLSCVGATPTTRTCVAAVYVADGQPCGDLTAGSASCAQGTCYNTAGTIALSGQTGSCKANAADGSPCNIESGPQCTVPARCIVTGGGSSGVCTVPSGTTCE